MAISLPTLVMIAQAV